MMFWKILSSKSNANAQKMQTDKHLRKERQTYLKINNTTHRHSLSLLTDAQHSRLV